MLTQRNHQTQEILSGYAPDLENVWKYMYIVHAALQIDSNGVATTYTLQSKTLIQKYP